MAKIFRRGKVFYAWVGGRKVSTGFTDRKAAKFALAKLERESVDPDNAAQATARTVDVLDDLLRSLARKGRAQATIDYTTEKAGHLRRLLPDHARDITHKVLEGFIDARLKEGAASATIKKELGVARGALKLARRNGLFARGVDEVLPELESGYVPRKRFISTWELVGLCNVLPPHRAAHACFIIATGARWGESVRARREDVSGGFVRLRGTKTKLAPRTVPIVFPFERILSWSLSRAGAELLFAPWKNVRHDLRRACAKLGVPPLSPNDLRRTFATWFRQLGIAPQLIAVAMGHTTSRMVETTYGRLPTEDLGRMLTASVGNDPLEDPDPIIPSESNDGGSYLGREGDEIVALQAFRRKTETSNPPGNSVARAGIEPATRGFSVRCSTN
jgi:integrase